MIDIEKLVKQIADDIKKENNGNYKVDQYNNSYVVLKKTDKGYSVVVSGRFKTKAKAIQKNE